MDCGLLLFEEIFLCSGIGLFPPELECLLFEWTPFKLSSISLLWCSNEVAGFERGIAREGRDISKPPSMLSNSGSDAYFLMPLVQCSSVKTSDGTWDERLELSKLSYPALNMDNWEDWNGLSNSR